MTYFHTLSTEPRTVQRPDGIEIHKTTWRGAHFKEAAYWGETEMLELASLAPKLRPIKITDDVANALAGMKLRKARRIEWLAAQVLTTGKVVVDADDADNPEKVSYNVDYQLADGATINLPTKFDAKDGAGVSLVNPIKFFRDLWDEARLSGAPYRPSEVLTTLDFVRVLRENTLFFDTWYQYNTVETDTQRERRPTWMFTDDIIIKAFETMTQMKLVFNETGYFAKDGTFTQFIPNGHMTIVYSGPGKLGEFTFTAHIHSGLGQAARRHRPVQLCRERFGEAQPLLLDFPRLSTACRVCSTTT